MKTPNNKFTIFKLQVAKKTKRQVAFWLLIANCMLPTANFFAQDKPKDDFKPSGKVWGYTFGDFYYKMGGERAFAEKDATADSMYVMKGDTTVGVKRWGDAEFAQKEKNHYAFTFRRIYLGYDYQFTKNISSRILLESSDGVLTSGGDRTVFIKALYLEWKDICKKQTLKLGQISTPTWSTFTESKWSYRSVEKTIGDMRKIGRSNDLGIGMSGSIADIKSTPADTAVKPKSLLNVSYNAMWGNGMGSKPENNYAKVVYGEVIFKIMNSILLEGYAEYDHSSALIKGGPQDGDRINTGKTIVKGFIGYEHEKFTIGMETVTQVQKNAKVAPIDSATGTKKDTTDLGQMGLSFWARGTITKDKLYAFARLDLFSPDTDRRGWEYYKKDSDVKRYNETFLVIGLDWRPAKNVQVMPSVWLNSYKDMSSNVKDYKATGANAYKIENIKRDADVVPRVTLFYKF
ncbi:MAG: hypothetical protein AABZ32_00695 [Bacteroidota bacterium]